MPGMPNQSLVRGLFLAAVALAFGIGALHLPLGDFTRAGPGLFPLMVSSLLFGIAVLTIVRSRVVPPVPLRLDVRNIALVMLGLGSFVVLSKLLGMAAGILALVFITALAGTSYSWKRNLGISAVLLLIAYAFQRLLGLNIHLV